MDPKENSYLNNETEDRADSRPMADSPLPKLQSKHEDPPASYQSLSAIQEEPSPSSISHSNTPVPLSSKKPEQSALLKTPESSNNFFRNVDYSGMSYQDLIPRSAQRVKIYENGEVEPDISWTEFKKRLIEKFKGKTSTPTQTPTSMNKVSKSEKKDELRRSQRLADIKSKTSQKRKVPEKVKNNYKKVKN